MPTAIVKLSEKANRVINVVKAKYGLNDKSEAINKLADEYEEFVLDPPLRSDFAARLKRVEKERVIKIKDLESYFDSLRKR